MKYCLLIVLGILATSLPVYGLEISSCNIANLQPGENYKEINASFCYAGLCLPSTIYIEPNKTTVSPGEVFAVDISVQDGTARSVLVNFSYDPSKVTYVSGTTQGLFNVMDTITGTPTVRYLGVSTSPVNVTNTKVATAVFRVNEGANGTIIFNFITANVDGEKALTFAIPIKIVQEPWQRYDRNGNGDVEDGELIAAIMDWLNGRLSDMDLINVITKWLRIVKPCLPSLGC